MDSLGCFYLIHNIFFCLEQVEALGGLGLVSLNLREGIEFPIS